MDWMDNLEWSQRGILEQCLMGIQGQALRSILGQGPRGILGQGPRGIQRRAQRGIQGRGLRGILEQGPSLPDIQGWSQDTLDCRVEHQADWPGLETFRTELLAADWEVPQTQYSVVPNQTHSWCSIWIEPFLRDRRD